MPYVDVLNELTIIHPGATPTDVAGGPIDLSAVRTQIGVGTPLQIRILCEEAVITSDGSDAIKLDLRFGTDGTDPATGAQVFWEKVYTGGTKMVAGDEELVPMPLTNLRYLWSFLDGTEGASSTLTSGRIRIFIEPHLG